MPTALRSNQHEMLGPDGESLLVFGTMDTMYLTTLHPSIEATDPRTGDVERVREDGVAFGEDYLGAKTVTFEMDVLTPRADDPHVANSDALDMLEDVWTDPDLRSQPDQIAVLRSMMTPGRIRRCYGRPRRYGDTPDSATKNGKTHVVADFLNGDGTWYDDTEKVLPVPMTAGDSGGFIAPIITTVDGYFATEMPAESVKVSMDVAGSRATWPIIVFHAGPEAPAQNPRVNIGDLVVELGDTIPAGMSVTVDPRPWHRTVLRSDGASRGGKLTYDTPPLRLLKVKRGSYLVTYTVTDASNASWAEVRWRDAYSRW